MHPLDSKYWSLLFLLMLASFVIAFGFFVQRTTTDISDALAAEVLQQQSDVAVIIHEYEVLSHALERKKIIGLEAVGANGTDDVSLAIEQMESHLEELRFGYTFERLDGVATVYAYAKPILEDVKQWVSDGVPGTQLDERSVAALASDRLSERYDALRDIETETYNVAREVIDEQSDYLSRFGKSLIFLLCAFALLVSGITAMLFRQRGLQAQLVDDQRSYAQRIEDFAEAGADWFWEMDQNLRLKYLSGSSMPVVTNPAADLANSPDSLPSAEQVIVKDHWPLRALSEQRGFNDYESQWLSTDGSGRTMSVSGKPLYSDETGQFLGFRGIARDVTARKQIELKLRQVNEHLIAAETRGREQAEQALRDSEIFLRTSIDALPQKLAILDQNGNVRVVNSAWRVFAANHRGASHNAEESIDVTAGDALLGEHYNDAFQRQSPQERVALAPVASEINLVLTGYSDKLRTEVQVLDEQQVRWLSVALSTFTSNNNRYAVLALEDVTERKQLEEHDRQLQAELAHFSRLTTVGELASGLAHELNQPLTAIIHNCDALMSGGVVGEPYDDEDLAAIVDIHEQSKRAGSIIKGLRKMVRKETGAVAATNINQLVTETIRLSMADARNHGISIRLNLVENLPKPHIDAVQIQQVLVNLTRNAVDAVRLAKPKFREVVVSTKNLNEGVRITVQDSACAITTEMKGMLFEPFNTTKPGGIGMGLPISRSIVESHGGQLWVDFDDPTMTTFHFAVPLTQDGFVGAGQGKDDMATKGLGPNTPSKVANIEESVDSARKRVW